VTLGRLHALGYSPEELFFVIGSDAFAEIASWNDYPDILNRAHFAVVSRPGVSIEQLPARVPALARRMVRPPHDASSPMIFLIDAATSDVSSTAIRERLATNRSIAGLVDPRVQQHIERHGLYASTQSGRRAPNEEPKPAAGRLHGQS
jgi:nicotinate-nucleotide adenylyltransferase